MIDSINSIEIIESFDINDVPKSTIKYFWLKIVSDGLGCPISVPLMVARGAQDGPTVGITAAVHGNELNGIPVIQRLFNELEVEELRGNIIAVPVANVPSFMRKQRRFNDGVDLNHIMPGKEDGSISEIYAYRIIDRIIKSFDYLLDLHTASGGRINSYYVRADMSHPIVNQLALLQNAQIIVHNPPSDGTLRGAADELGIPAITLEVGNPNTYQKKLIRSGVEGIHNVLCHLDMVSEEIVPAETETIMCKKSYWLYTDKGGLMTVYSNLLEKVKKGDTVAILRDVFGQKIKDFYAPEDGVVIGKSTSPVNQSGGRILHLGIE
ncbi:MAG: putative deacylase [Patiriisocius sp.]|jgi:predicted deacylase